MDHPSFGIIGNDRLPRLVRNVSQAGIDAHPQSFVKPLQSALPRHLEGASDLTHRLAGGITPQDLSAMYVAEGGSLRVAQLSQGLFFLVGENEFLDV